MPHETDQRTRDVLAEIEVAQQLGVRGHPLLKRLGEELFPNQVVPPCELRWELIATSLYLADSPTRWGTQFGPSMSGVQEDGTHVDSPSLEAITRDCVSYWQSRMRECRQPTLRALYADLVWEFSRKASGEKPPIEAARIAIDSYLEAVLDDRRDPPGQDDEAINRLLALCVLVGDDTRLRDACQKLIIRAETAESDEARGWQRRDLFPLLLQIPRKKWPRDFLDELAQRLRQQLDATPLGTAKQWARRAIAIPLADFYWQTGQKESVHTVLRHYGESEVDEAVSANAMMAVGWLETLFNLYQKYEMHDDAKSILWLIEARQTELPNLLLPVESQIVLKKQEADEWVASLMAETLELTLANLVFSFRPRLEVDRQEIRDLEKEHPLMAVIGAATSLVDHEGRIIARIEDDDGKLVRYQTQNAQICDIFLQLAFPAIIQRFQITADSFLQELSKSPVWSQERSPILHRALSAFLEGDPIVTIHLLVTEIESALRNLARNCGVVLQKPHRRGGYVLKNLDDLLRENTVVSILTIDFTVHLRAILTDQRGWNLRNAVCHGLSPAKSLDMPTARRLVLISFFLGLLRKSSAEEQQM
ncbi:DUF4209 domain-containing protein [Planctomicrobium sp. SH527]|uniref:DUF4209 domain-containing protein n=1 Tax=Planctomicrobium sp. SH527 TaxID=3448123 RepID=UPI003F5AF058